MIQLCTAWSCCQINEQGGTVGLLTRGARSCQGPEKVQGALSLRFSALLTAATLILHEMELKYSVH